MILESSILLSGLTASPGQITTLPNLFTGVSISLGQIILATQAISGISFCAGRLIHNVNLKLPPDIFMVLFGNHAYQNSDFLVIDKRNLTGLTPNFNNTVESMLVGIICRNIINGGILTPKIDINYWGYGYNDGKKVDTILFNVYTLITNNSNELTDYTTLVNPNDY